MIFRIYPKFLLFERTYKLLLIVFIKSTKIQFKNKKSREINLEKIIILALNYNSIIIFYSRDKFIKKNSFSQIFYIYFLKT